MNFDTLCVIFGQLYDFIGIFNVAIREQKHSLLSFIVSIHTKLHWFEDIGAAQVCFVLQVYFIKDLFHGLVVIDISNSGITFAAGYK